MSVVDFHNHLMPGVDDGAQTEDDARAALQAFQDDGVNVVVATPHLDGSLTRDPAQLADKLAELDAAFAQLQAIAREFKGMRVDRGVELRLDVPEPDLSDARLRLGGGRFFLMEFPWMGVPPQSGRALAGIVATGYTPIVAHPERYTGFSLELASEWKEQGALLQVNGGSVLGRYGSEARRHAGELLARGWVDYLCSDYHARGATLVAQYRAVLSEMGAAEQAHTLMETNPRRMLDGERPLPVVPIQPAKAGMWHRMTAMFR